MTKAVYLGLGLATGVIVGFAMAWCWNVYFGELGSYTSRIDNNSDGAPDAEYRYEQGILSQSLQDRNFDGQWDYWEWFNHHGIQRAEADNNFDGRVDAWLEYELGNLKQSRQDLDNNQEADAIHHYRFGVILLSMGRPNGSTNHAWVEFYREGSLWKEFRDRDGDGLLEHLTVYGWFGDMEYEEVLKPAIDPTHARP